MTWNICFLNRTSANKKVVNRYNICFLADWDAVHLDTLANINDVYNLQYAKLIIIIHKLQKTLIEVL